MKRQLLIIAFSFILAAPSSPAITSDNGTTSTPKIPPVKGMTEARAKEYYGEPFTRMATDHGVRWYYRLKFDEVYGRALVPFYFDSSNVRWGSIDFGPDGRVVRSDWQKMASK